MAANTIDKNIPPPPPGFEYESIPDGFELESQAPEQTPTPPPGFEFEQGEEQPDEMRAAYGIKAASEQNPISRYLTDAALRPMVEFTKAFHGGADSMLQTLAGATSLAEDIFWAKASSKVGHNPKLLEHLHNSFAQKVNSQTGIKVPSFEEMSKAASSLVTQYAQEAGNIEASMPETDMGYNSILPQLVGRAPSIAAEFAMGSKAIGVNPATLNAGVAKSLTTSAQFAVVEALNSYAESPTVGTLITEGTKGAAINAAFAITGELALHAGDLLRRSGRNAARVFVRTVTGSDDAAKAFASNPKEFLKKYDYEKRLIDLKNKRQDLELQLKNNIKIFQEQRTINDKTASNVLSDSMRKTRESFRTANENFKLGKQIKLEEQILKTKENISAMESALRDKTVNIFDSTLTHYKDMRKMTIDAVDDAANQLSQIDPTLRISGRAIKSHIKKAERTTPIMKLIPYQMKDGKFVANTKIGSLTGADKEVEVLNNVMEELNTRMRTDDFPLFVAHNLKKDLHTLGNMTSNPRLKLFYSRMSKVLNPANYSNSVFRSRHPSSVVATKALNHYKKMNEAANSFIDQYNEAMNLYYKQNANGQAVIPNIERVIAGIRSNDRGMIRRMQFADKALPEGNKLFPAVKQLADDTVRVEKAEQDALVAIKKSIARRERGLMRAQRQTILQLNTSHSEIRLGAQKETSQAVRDYATMQHKEHQALFNDVDEAEKFLRYHALVNQIHAEEFPANVIQRALGYTALFQGFRGDFPAAGRFGAASFLLSPKAAKFAGLASMAGSNFAAKGADLVGKKIIAPLLKSSLGRQMSAKELKRLLKKKD